MACSAETDETGQVPSQNVTGETPTDPGGQGFAPPATTGSGAPTGNTPAPKPADDPGPAPAGCSGITKDKDGFFKRTTSASDYVAFVPKGYAGKPTTLVVGLHGCGDSAYNFATWGVNPFKTRTTQGHIGISIGGKDGKCWDANGDQAKVTAAIADISTCFYVHQQKVVLAGYSSGGILAYRMGLANADKFAGILIENSGLGGANPSAASWKINVAHTAHDGDTEFPLAKVQADWNKLTAAGIPLQKRNVPGTHDGTSDDWSDWLLPKIAGWKAP
ncbi:MAG: hypothetical protein JST00_39145 [Deltaproteobacteria bacterium]|nr:hypothetical protein [Deltaproteobacteria bacterium]